MDRVKGAAGKIKSICLCNGGLVGVRFAGGYRDQKPCLLRRRNEDRLYIVCGCIIGVRLDALADQSPSLMARADGT
jgi:hypothetical protein